MEAVVARLVAGLEKGMAYVTALVDEALQILWISPSASDLTGWSADQLIGANALEFVHPDDLEGVARLLEAERADPHPYGSDPARLAVNRIRFRMIDGGWRSFDIAANNQCENPEVRGFVFIMSDTTVQRLMDGIYDSMAAGMPVATTAARVAELLSRQTEGSQVTVSLHGMEPITAGHSVAGRSDVIVELPPHGRISVEHASERPPSAWFVVLAERAAALLDIAVTRHLGEVGLRRRLDEKTALISAVSHDLRSPVAAIHLMASLLEDSSDALTVEQRRELARRIGVDARRTSRLLADLTSLDRLLHGSSDLVTQRVSLHGLIGRVLSEVDGPDHTVVLVPDTVGHAAVADPVLTERIVDNLVVNALKHTPVGSRIEVSIHVHGDRDLVVHVDDDGPGIAAPMRAALFDAYVRGDETSMHPGTGMGLYLVRTFADVQGGGVECSESPLGGARFSVTLPRWFD